jgi:hypothetical protein
MSETLMERATSRGQRKYAVFKDRATYGGNVFHHIWWGKQLTR